MPIEEHSSYALRPSIPPLFWLATGAWAGVVTAEALSWQVFAHGVASWIVWLAPAFFAAVLGLMLSRRMILCALLLTGLLAGVTAGTAFWGWWRERVVDARDSAQEAFRVTSAVDPGKGRFGEYFLGTVMLLDRNAAGRGGTRTIIAREVRVRVTCSEGVPPLELGQAGVVRGEVLPAAGTERGRMMHRSGRVAEIDASSVTEVAFMRGVRGAIGRLRGAAVRRIESVPGEAGALVAGVTLGDRRRMAGSVAEGDFRTTGLSHLVAVSGSHLVVVAAVFAWALERLRLGKSYRAALLLGVMAAYVVATGVQASAVRAVLMSGAVAVVGLLWRRTDRMATLAAGVALAVVISPSVAFDAGFQLSVCSVLGLVVFGRLATGWIEAALPRRLSILAEPLALTVVAQLATLPVAIPLFGVVSTIAPVANLVVGPLVTVVLLAGLGGLVADVAVPPVGGALLGVAGAAASLSVDIASHLASVPLASVPVVAGGSLVAALVIGPALLVWAFWPRPSAGLGRLAMAATVFVLAVTLVGPRPSYSAEVVVLDVGQGDAVLVRDGAQVALIDTGPSPSALTQALTRSGVRNVDLVALTHLHDDHAGGVDALAGTGRIGRLLVPPSQSGEWQADASVAALQPSAGMGQVRAGDSARVGETLLAVLWPEDAVDDAAENASSMILLVQRGDRTVLLTGDAESSELEALIAQGALGDIDVLKVGHHGSRESVSASVLERLRPEEAVISVGEGNKFGHPTSDTLALLREAGCDVRRTDQEGDVHIPLTSADSAVTGSWSHVIAAARTNTRRVPVPVGLNTPNECATLGETTKTRVNGTHGRTTGRLEAGLSDHQRTAHAGGPGREQAPQQGGRGRRPRLQFHDVRFREHEPRRRHRRMQHVAFHERAPPRDRPQRREAQQGLLGQTG